MKAWILRYVDFNDHETLIISSTAPTKEDRKHGDYRLKATVEIELPAKHKLSLDEPYGNDNWYY